MAAEITIDDTRYTVTKTIGGVPVINSNAGPVWFALASNGGDTLSVWFRGERTELLRMLKSFKNVLITREERVNEFMVGNE